MISYLDYIYALVNFTVEYIGLGLTVVNIYMYIYRDCEYSYAIKPCRERRKYFYKSEFVSVSNMTFMLCF